LQQFAVEAADGNSAEPRGEANSMFNYGLSKSCPLCVFCHIDMVQRLFHSPVQ